jgi:hypothetical protein
MNPKIVVSSFLKRLVMAGFYKPLHMAEYYIEVYKNPDSEEMRECEDEYHTVRGVILQDKKDLYVWTPDLGDTYKGDIVEHEFVLRKMGWMSRPFIPLVFNARTKKVEFSSFFYSNSPLCLKSDKTNFNEKLQEVPGIIRDNKNIQSLGYRVSDTPNGA